MDPFDTQTRSWMPNNQMEGYILKQIIYNYAHMYLNYLAEEAHCYKKGHLFVSIHLKLTEIFINLEYDCKCMINYGK